MKEIYIKEDEKVKKIYLIENNIILEKHEESNLSANCSHRNAVAWTCPEC